MEKLAKMLTLSLMVTVVKGDDEITTRSRAEIVFSEKTTFENVANFIEKANDIFKKFVKNSKKHNSCVITLDNGLYVFNEDENGNPKATKKSNVFYVGYNPQIVGDEITEIMLSNDKGDYIVLTKDIMESLKKL